MDLLGLASLAGSVAPWALLLLAVWWALRQVRARQAAEVDAAVQRRMVRGLSEHIEILRASQARLATDLKVIEAERKQWNEQQAAKPAPRPGDHLGLGGAPPAGRL